MRILPIAAAMLLALPGIAAAEYKPERGSTIEVRGVGSVERKPEIARFGATIRTRGDTLKAVTAAHKARIAQAAGPLGRLGEGARLRKTTFSVDQKSDNYATGSAPAKRWFEAVTDHSIEVTDMRRINEVVSGLFDSGLFEFDRMYFSIRDTGAAEDEAREAAVVEARRRAESLARAAAMTLGEVLHINDTDAYPTPPDGYADMPPPEVNSIGIVPPETLTYSATVDTTWRIAPR